MLDEVVGAGQCYSDPRLSLKRKLLGCVGLFPTATKVMVAGVAGTCSELQLTLPGGVDTLHLMEQGGVLSGGLPTRHRRPLGPRPGVASVASSLSWSGAVPVGRNAGASASASGPSAWHDYDASVVEWAVSASTRPGRLSDAAIQQLSQFLTNPAGACRLPCNCLLCLSLTVSPFCFVLFGGT